MRIRTFIPALAAALIVAGCADYNRPWPKLTDPLPGNASADPTATELASAQVPTKPAPLALAASDDDSLAAIEADVAADQQTYLKLRRHLETFKEPDQGLDPLTPWHDAQLALTRISQQTDRLDALAQKAGVDKAALEALRASIQAFVQQETRLMNSLRPAG